jgi:hypothetical protein
MNVSTSEEPLANPSDKTAGQTASPINHWVMEIAILITKKWTYFIFIVIGLFGNTASFMITAKKQNRRITTCVYMTALAVVDNILLVTWFLLTLLSYHGLGDSIRDRATYRR